MSEYASQVMAERRNPAGSTVGRDLEGTMPMSLNHPRYVRQTEYAERVFAERMAKEVSKRSNAKQAVCTPVLSASQRDVVGDDYPEFRVVWARLNARVHPMFIARRQLVNQLMTFLAQKYAGDFVHYGGTAISYMTAGIEKVHLEVDTSSVVAMSSNYQDAVDCVTVMSSVAAAAESVNWYFGQNCRRVYREGSAWMTCTAGHMCRHQAAALIVDGSMYNMSTTQFMFAMQQHGADIGYFALPYTSSMMLVDRGDIADTGVKYEVVGDTIRFAYPDGVVGVNSYQPDAWHDWLTNSERNRPGLKSNYQFEMFDHRVGFQVIRVTRVDKRVVPKQVVVHSLQLPDRKDKMLVSAWVLKGLTGRGQNKDAWERKVVLMPRDAVEKAYEYAMAMPPEDFSRVNIRKRLEVYNDRFIVEGQRVMVREPLTIEQVNVTEMAIFVRCFVERYEANQLSRNLMDILKLKEYFGGYPSNFVRFFIGVHFVLTSVLLVPYRFVDDTVRGVLDSAIGWLRNKKIPTDTEFVPAPTFMRLEDVLRPGLPKYLERLRTLITTPSTVASACSGVAGYVQALALGSSKMGDSSDYQFRTDYDSKGVSSSASVFTDVVDTSLGAPSTLAGDTLYGQLSATNEFDQASSTRHLVSKAWVGANADADIQRDDYRLDPGFIDTINEAHETLFPGMAEPDFYFDSAIMALNDQHRNFTADYLRMSTNMNELPTKMRVYKSKITAYNTSKRRNILPEILSSIESRNLAAPMVSRPQNDDVMIRLVWDNFLNTMCADDAREKLLRYQAEPIGLEEAALKDWASKARPDNLAKIVKYVAEHPEAWEEMRVDEYNAMIKSDVKPPLSDKPLHSYLASQVIVHHKPVINAIFSSILRVLVRRFESLLKPNVYVNLLKDMPYIEDVIRAYHKWSDNPHYLENDFSKFDKSQHRFVFLMETFVYQQLGMNQDLLDKWEIGHVDCDIRALNASLSLHVRYQRKSGDAGTAFANGLVNCMSVAYAYQGTPIDWAVFIGDDSLVCTEKVVGSETAVASLAEVFNLVAKYYDTPVPYFASNFIVMNKREKRVTAVPDPFKRAEKYSVGVPADDPKWRERYISAKQSMAPYLRVGSVAGLEEMIPQRYNTRGFNMRALIDAMASSVASFENFRSMWETEPTVITF